MNDEEHVRSICRAWMDFGFSVKSFLDDPAVAAVPKERLVEIWNEEVEAKKKWKEGA